MSRTPAKIGTPRSTKKRRAKRNTPQKPLYVFDDTKEPLQVFLRLRPFESSKGSKDYCCIEQEGKSEVIIETETVKPQKFSYTGILDGFATQQDVFEKCGKPLLCSLLEDRKDGLLFAYGNTGAGKTHTIKGNKLDPGIAPRIADHLFGAIERSKRGEKPIPGEISADPACEYRVWASYIEIYNEEIYDLLETPRKDGKRTCLKIKGDQQGTPYVKNATEVQVRTAEDAKVVFMNGQKNRKAGATRLNIESSRSHSIFSLKVVSYRKEVKARLLHDNLDGNLHQYSKISIVDLAGSERAKKAQTSGDRLTEAGNINKSLMMLRWCLKTMRENQLHPENQKIIPFRDSKLTMLLQEGFIGKGRAIMIANCNPNSSFAEETVYALQFSALVTNMNTAGTSQARIRREKKEAADRARASAREAAREAERENRRITQSPLTGNKKRVSRRPSIAQPSPLARSDVRTRGLIVENRELKQKLAVAESRCIQVETAVREEMSQEMTVMMSKLEYQYRTQMAKESSMLEEKFERKIDILNNHIASYGGLPGAMAASKQMNEKLQKAERTLATSKTTIENLSKQLRETLMEKDILEARIVRLETTAQQAAANYDKEKRALQRTVSELRGQIMGPSVRMNSPMDPPKAYPQMFLGGETADSPSLSQLFSHEIEQEENKKFKNQFSLSPTQNIPSITTTTTTRGEEGGVPKIVVTPPKEEQSSPLPWSPVTKSENPDISFQGTDGSFCMRTDTFEDVPLNEEDLEDIPLDNEDADTPTKAKRKHKRGKLKRLGKLKAKEGKKKLRRKRKKQTDQFTEEDGEDDNPHVTYQHKAILNTMEEMPVDSPIKEVHAGAGGAMYVSGSGSSSPSLSNRRRSSGGWTSKGEQFASLYFMPTEQLSPAPRVSLGQLVDEEAEHGRPRRSTSSHRLSTFNSSLVKGLGKENSPDPFTKQSTYGGKYTAPTTGSSRRNLHRPNTANEYFH